MNEQEKLKRKENLKQIVIIIFLLSAGFLLGKFHPKS